MKNFLLSAVFCALAFPALAGSPVYDTPAPGDNSTHAATTQWVNQNTVVSVNGRQGAVTLTASDILTGNMVAPLHMGTQLLDGSNIAFTGGTLNGVTIGGTTPAAITGSTLAVTGTTTLSGAFTVNPSASVSNFKGPIAISPGNNINIGTTASVLTTNLPFSDAGFTYSGTYTGNVLTYPLNEIAVSADRINAGTSQVAGLYLAHNYGGTSATGPRWSFVVDSSQIATCSPGPCGAFGASQLNVQASSPDGGTSGMAVGQLWGLNINPTLQVGANYYGYMYGLEIDMRNKATGLDKKIGLGIHTANADAGQGATTDMALEFSRSPQSSSPFKTLIGIGKADADFPIDPAGAIMEPQINKAGATGRVASVALATARGLNFNYVQFTGNAFASPEFAIDGGGFAYFGQSKLSFNATSVSLDIPYQIASATALSNAGTIGVAYPGDYLYGSYGGIYQVATSKVVGATVAAAGSGGTTGTQTVTGTTGTGTPFQASVAVSGGIITAVNSITVPGSYTANPTNPQAEPVTGGGLTGASLDLTIGVATYAPVSGHPDRASGAPTSIALTGATVSGVTLTPTWTNANTLKVNPSGGNTVIGTGAALATNAASGFLMLPSIAGLPTGTVGSAGNVAVVVDTTDNKLCWSAGGGTWKCVTGS